jgi:predicted flap endonuclease-1-like 5' DNA nuclease
MSLGNPTNIVIIALLGIAALLFIIASFSGGGKWRRLYQEESEDYAAYADRADQDLRDARQCIAELEASRAALQQEHSDALAEIARLTSSSRTAEAPVVVPLASQTTMEAPAIEPPPAPEPRPIAPEAAAAETDARPIAPFSAPMTELPPAPIHGVTPLRAVEPPEAEIAAQAPAHAEPVAEAMPSAGESAHADAPEHPAKASPFSTLAHLAEGAAVAEVAHLAWNAYSSHKHQAEAEHVAEHAEAPEPEVVPHATVEHAVEVPHTAPTAPAAEVADIEPAAEAPAKAWFGAGKRDDLMRMRGVDSVMNTRLFGLGVTTFDDVVQLSQEDEMALEQRLGVPAGYITREQWREQASLLRFGKDAEFHERFGNAEA